MGTQFESVNTLSLQEIVQILAVKATNEQNAYMVTMTIRYNGQEPPIQVDYFSRPDDPYGLNPVLRKWLTGNLGQYEISAYVPPQPRTLEEIRDQMASLTARQLRLALVRDGISLAAIESALESMPMGQTRDEAKIEWEYASTYNRTHQLIEIIGLAVGLTAEQIDTMWQSAVSI